MKINLKSLALENFRGIKSLQLELDGENVIVYGRNGTGKTSIAEAIHYLLFNQSVHEKSIEIVPKDKEQNELKELTPTVKATFIIDGEEVTLERRSVYNKSTNGRSNKQFINEVDKSVTDYNAYINNLIDVDQFKLLTNPSTFFKMNAQERRNVLTELVSDITDEDIIASNSDFKNVPSVVGNISIDERKSVLKRSIRQVKKDIEAIPIRIEENLANVNTEVTAHEEDLNSEIGEHVQEVERLQQKLAEVKSADPKERINKQIKDKEAEIKQFTLNLNSEKDNKIIGKNSEIHMLKGDLSALQRQQDHDNSVLKQLSNEREALIKQHKDIVNEAKEVQKRQFEYEPKEVCECCTQSIAQYLQEAIKAKELERFNLNKSKTLEGLKNVIQEVIEQGRSKTKQMHEVNNSITERKAKLEHAKSEVEKAERALERIKNAKPSEADQQALDALEAELETLKAQLNDNAGTSNADEIKRINSQIEVEQADINHLNNLIEIIERNKKLHERVEDLKQEEQKLQEKLDQYEGELDLLDQFTKFKMQSITEAINDKFKLIKVNLFKEENNGKIKVDCDITIDGVSYYNGMNTANQINAGLDVANTLANHYQIYVPMFIDNAEAVNELEQTDQQQIQLKVSDLKKHEKLEIKKVD